MFSWFKKPDKKTTDNPAALPETAIERYKRLGNLRVGDNSEVSKMGLHIYETDTNYPNITIGEDCIINGSIVLHAKASKVVIGDRVFIGPNTTFFVYDEIFIGDDTMISWGCTLIDTNAHSLKSEERKNDVLDWKKGWEYKNWSVVESKKIAIHPKSWIGFNSIIMKGVELGEGCVVASGSVVTKEFESFSVIAGNPAKFIKKTE